MIIQNTLRIVGCSIVLAGISACSKDSSVKEDNKPATQAVITNRLQIPPEVVNNLGITFEKVRTGKVGQWLTVPGSLNVPQERRYTVRAPAAGRIKLTKGLWAKVSKGEVFAEIVSPDLVAAQGELVAALNQFEHARADSTLPAAQLRRQQSERAYLQKLKVFSVLTGTSEESLLEKEASGSPHWLAISVLTLKAPGNGSIIKLLAADGDIVDGGSEVAEVVDTSELLFSGNALEVDLGKLKEGTRVQVIPGSEGFPPIDTELSQLPPVTNKETHTALVEARVPNEGNRIPDGLSASARILLKEGEYDEAVIPADCVIADGLELIIFKRDSAKPDFVIRTSVELGGRNDKEVEVLSGVMEGEEVVRNGLYQLKQTGLGKAPQGGHFHADGTWHEGDK